MVRAKNAPATDPQAFHRADVLDRIHLVGELAGPDVGRPNVLVDQIVFSRKQPAALNWRYVSGVTRNSGQYIQSDLH